MQPDLVSLTLNLTLDEAQDMLCHLWELRHGDGSGVTPAYYESRTVDGVKTAVIGTPQAASLTVPVSALVAPDYQPPQGPLAAQAQPAPAPSWQPPQVLLAAQPQAPNPPVMPQPWQQQQPVMPIPTAAPAYTLDQLATAAAPLMDAGRGPELTAMLSLFGVASLNQIPPERYPDVALNLRAMGASL
jgi:hypothetical protein